MAANSEAYGDACERARKHVRRERKVWRQGFIAVHALATTVLQWAGRNGGALVFFFDGDGGPVMGGHKTAGYWRRGFQRGDEEGTRFGCVYGSFGRWCAGWTGDAAAMGGH